MNYKIDQLEQEALLRDEDETQLHELLKYKIKKVQQKKVLPDIIDLYHFEEKKGPKPLPEEEKAYADQRLYHAMANSFKKKTKNGLFRLMTRKSM